MPGRDAFIEILCKHGLMVHLRRRKRYKTTDSNHHYRKYPNLIKEIVSMRPSEIWVADFTYVETEEGVCYLSLITDADSGRGAHAERSTTTMLEKWMGHSIK